MAELQNFARIPKGWPTIRTEEPTPRKNRTIVLPSDQEKYMSIIEDAKKTRKEVDSFIETFPELFPCGIEKGYVMKEIRRSKKSGMSIRRIEVEGISHTIRPSFIMPYHVASAVDVSKPLFLRKFNVPFRALAHVFGKDAMFWYRIEQSLGRNSIVGTTVRNPDLLPEHLAADEKHSGLKGNKVCVATTVGEQCILGASISEDAGEKGLKAAYGKFREEAPDLNPEYCPKSVNNDGWKATVNSWESLFPGIIIIACFLHVFIKIRDRSGKKFRELFSMAADKLWYCCEACSKASFSQRLRRLCEWVDSEKLPDTISKPIMKLKDNILRYSKCYDLPGCHRTSNMVDRLMQRMDRHLFSTFYFHGSLSAAELSIRGWALIHNFAPCNPITVKKHGGLRCPAEWLNKSKYHENWLQNLLTSSSMGGFRNLPPNPL
jgi:hypothetical protein